MKIVIIGGTGLIGTKLAGKLREKGHEVVPAAPSTGVNTITGEGLEKALSGAEIVVDVSSDGQIVRLSPALFQPVASDDVAAALADVTLGAPVNGIVELAGPEKCSLDEFGRKYLIATNDPRRVAADIHARYFGAELDDQSLTPVNNPRLGSLRFEDWLGKPRK